MIYPGIAIQQTDVDLCSKLRLGLGLATDNRANMRLMNAHDAIFYLMAPQITVDAEITFSQITPDFIEGLKLFNPFGPENENPVFLTRNVTDSGYSKLVGKGQRHIKLDVIDSSVRTPLPGIAFAQHYYYERIKEGKPVDICYTIEENTHGSRSYTQLMVKDIKE
jgi:single-stranded-DNA-specific exonuclease